MAEAQAPVCETMAGGATGDAPETPFTVAGPGEVSWLMMRDGFQLHMQTWRAEEPLGIALYLHGWNEMIDSLVVRRLAAALLAKRITLVAYDSNMHGKSMGWWPRCCAGNAFDMNTASGHCVDVAEAVLKTHKKLPFILVGHGMGGGCAMLSTERVAELCREPWIDVPFRAVFLAPSNVTRVRDGCRRAFCPLCCAYGICCYFCFPSSELQETYGVPGDKTSRASQLMWIKFGCKTCVPEDCGGFPGYKWWSAHHGNVPYTILQGDQDTDVHLIEQTMMQGWAPHGKLEVLEGAGHDVFTNKEPKWQEWVEKTATVVAHYCTTGRKSESGSASKKDKQLKKVKRQA